MAIKYTKFSMLCLRQFNYEHNYCYYTSIIIVVVRVKIGAFYSNGIFVEIYCISIKFQPSFFSVC